MYNGLYELLLFRRLPHSTLATTRSEPLLHRVYGIPVDASVPTWSMDGGLLTEAALDTCVAASVVIADAASLLDAGTGELVVSTNVTDEAFEDTVMLEATDTEA